MKKNIVSAFMMATVLLVTGCTPGTPAEPGFLYSIGDTGPAGGLIFYIDEANVYDWTYLEVAPQSTEWSLKVWGGYGTTLIGADGTGIGTGKQNTIDIVNQFGAQEPYESKTDYAAKLCSDLVSGGYNDWFLPSKDELNAIWDNLVSDGTGSNSGVGTFSDLYYWSSSEFDSDYAWYQYFYDGSQEDNGGKNYTRLVRAVRSF